MTGSRRTRTPTPRRQAPRRPACVPATHRPLDDERVFAEPPTADGLKVTVRVIPLPESESNPLRARQLAVIVELLRRATAEAEQEKAAKRHKRREGS
jgi:hypothetical protein